MRNQSSLYRAMLPVGLFAAAIALCLPRAALAGETAVASAPAGYITLNIAGTNGTNSSALSFLGLGLTQPAQFRGQIASANGEVITDKGGSWSDNQYNAPEGSYYIELTSGIGAGLTSQITATDAAAKSLSLADDLSAYASSGVTYVIRKNWTLASVFGPEDESGLGGGSATTADQVLVYNSLTQQYATYYYKTTAFPANSGTGWRSTTETSVDASNTLFNPYDGIMVRRYQPSNLHIKLTGAVKIGATDLPVNAGLNILNNVYPGGTFTLGNSGLYTGSSVTGLKGGSSTTADQVMIYNSAAGTYGTYYYQTTSIPPGSGKGWRSMDSASADVSATALPAGSSVLINRVEDTPFDWIAPQPFVSD